MLTAKLHRHPYIEAVRWSQDRRIGILLLGVAAGTNVVTPLLLIYRDEMRMSSTALTALFGVYALGLVPALALAGPASDRWGRRRVVLPAAVLSVVTSVIYVAAEHNEVLLFMVRFVQGAGAGATFSVGSAWLVEAAIRDGRRSGPRTATVMMTSGFAIGPVVAGLIGEWGPWPLVLPYLLHAGGLLVAVLIAWSVTETMPTPAASTAVSPVAMFRPGKARIAVLVVAPLAVCVYAFPSTALIGIPLLIGLPVAPVAMTGLLAGLTLGAGAIAAPMQARLGVRTAPVAAACGAAGFAAITVAAAVPPVFLLAVPAAVILGAGGGLALASGLARLSEVASPGRLGTVAAAFYAFAYLGFAVPILLSALTAFAGIALWVAILAVVCVLLTVQQKRANL